VLNIALGFLSASGNIRLLL